MPTVSHGEISHASGVGGTQKGWDRAQHRDLELLDDSSQTFLGRGWWERCRGLAKILVKNNVQHITSTSTVYEFLL